MIKMGPAKIEKKEINTKLNRSYSDSLANNE